MLATNVLNNASVGKILLIPDTTKEGREASHAPPPLSLPPQPLLKKAQRTLTQYVPWVVQPWPPSPPKPS